MTKAELEKRVQELEQLTAALEKSLSNSRELATRLASERDEAVQQLPAVAERQPFAKRTQPVNGFQVTIAGANRFEDEIWIEAVGDTVVILTGKKAKARWSGDESVVVRATAAAPVFQHAPAASQHHSHGPEGQWFGPPPHSPIGTGDFNPQMSAEDARQALATGDLAFLEGTAARIAAGDTSPVS